MWRKSGIEAAPEILTGEHSDDYGSGLTQQTGALERQLMKEPAQTMIGVFAQLSVIREWVDNGLPNSGEAAIKAYHDRVDSALRDAAAERGFDMPAYPGPMGAAISST